MFHYPILRRIGRRPALLGAQVLVLLALGVVAALPGVHAQTGTVHFDRPAAAGRTVVAARSLKNDVSAPLRSVAPVAPRAASAGALPRPAGQPGAGRRSVDAVVQSFARLLGPAAMPAPSQNFEGNRNLTGASRPDTNGDVGSGHYVQWVNLHFSIWDKSGNLVYGPAAGNTLWEGFGGACEFTNDGDPIALYDPIADRWFLSQVAFGNGSAGAHQCVAVSTTPDPTGSYYRYDFYISDTLRNADPKFGVWPDGYYAAFNLYNPTGGFAGPVAAAFDRAQMLVGQPAYMQSVHLPNTDANLLPADLDGTRLPPAGAANTFAEAYANDVNGAGKLRLFQFHVDWDNRANSTFTGPATLDVASWNPLCPLSACIPQPGTPAQLDGVGDRLMYRLAYRNFGTYESLVVNHSVDTSVTTDTVHAGLRWYEIRSPRFFPNIYQQGTYAPDTTNRWLGSIAQDHLGNIALGYNVADATVFPGLRYTGRLVSDPVNTLPQGEADLQAGGGSQTSTAGSWGAAAMMAVDPVDDCTFWFTGEYYAATSATGWQTRIGAFAFPNCAPVEPTATRPAPPPSVTPPLSPTPRPTLTQAPTNSPTLTQTPTRTPTETPTQTPTITQTPSQTPVVSFPAVIHGGISARDRTQVGILTRDGQPSRCDLSKDCPGVETSTAARHFDQYTFINPNDSPVCVSVRIDTTCTVADNTSIFSAMYLGSFDPTNLCVNYLGDMGNSTILQTGYEVTVPAHAQYLVVVNEVTPNGGCPSYTLTVDQSTQATSTPSPSPTPCDTSFRDVPPGDPFYTPIGALACRGVISGYTNSDGSLSFRPGNPATRAQMVKIIVNAFAVPSFTPTTGTTFRDVPRSYPFFDFIEAANHAGVVSGYSCGTNCLEFRPTANVTRAQLSKIVAVAANWVLIDPTSRTFEDVTPANTFYRYIETAVCHRVVSGYVCGSLPTEPCVAPQNRPYFRPQSNATRAQIAKIVYNALSSSRTCATAAPSR